MSSVTVLFQLEELKSATERTGAERKEHHCEQLPIPIALTLLFDSQYCYKRAACLSKRSLEEKLRVGK
ncbi:hypothetical protein Q8A67_019308 [Cirrhinus molitorella]|uniref:Uncharacterized protein n=1 Tax=Cirrhinus molitorella TaxID=172907 RepID=A0AA88THT7_9TELE|nr:hypothetical protein Q8A67_019308 [Cirrhinus molitorella]